MGNPAGLGFHQSEPDPAQPCPNAWCDDCELIRSAHGGWNEESEELVKISLLRSHCYERARIRNTRPPVTLDDLAGLRRKCGYCEEWHGGPCLDFGYRAPGYWTDEHERISKRQSLLPGWIKKPEKAFLNEDYCAIGETDFFVRGLISLPIIGTDRLFSWGVWGSLSRENFAKLQAVADDPKRTELPTMFSWLSNDVPEYPDTLNIKMYLHTQQPGRRPEFELQESDHPLSHEYHHGISPQRVKEIMLQRLRDDG